MPTTLKLSKLALQLLVDYVSKPGPANGYADVYIGGQLMADVFPRFGDAEGEIKPLQPPVPRVMTSNGQPDWAKLTPAESEVLRGEIKTHNANYVKWCDETAPEFELTDKQFTYCQKVLRFFQPRSEEDKAKDKAAGIPPREEYTPSKVMFQLLREFKLSE